MAGAEQIKSLIKSFGEGDENRFFATAVQIAASEARKGHSRFAQDLKSAIDRAKRDRSVRFLDAKKTIPLSSAKGDFNELVDVFHPKIKLNDMVLDHDVRQALERVIIEQRKFDLLHQHGLMPKRKLLLTGAPGCGKTMTAQAIAGELGLPVLIIRLDGLISKYMGESIAKLRLIFDAMEQHRGVYLFDEFDSIGTHRTSGQDVGEIKRVLNSFLVNIEKDNSNSILVAATNLPEALDKALFRRFDDIINYPLPKVEEVADVLKRLLNRYGVSESTFQQLAKESLGLSYSAVVQACEESIKEMIIFDRSSIALESLFTYLHKRKEQVHGREGTRTS